MRGARRRVAERGAVFRGAVHCNIGRNLAAKGNQTGAIRYYREAVSLNPKYVHAVNNLANVLKERNELQEAEELLSLAVQMQPDFAAAWMSLGTARSSLKRFETAKQSYPTASKQKEIPRLLLQPPASADLNRQVDALNVEKCTELKPARSLAWNNVVTLLTTQVMQPKPRQLEETHWN